MLVALLALTGGRVRAEQADRKWVCQCPECRQTLILKRGRIKIPHFAHPKYSQCFFAEGESARHREMKHQILQFVDLGRAEPEWPWIPGRRADVALLDLEIAVECQASPLSTEEWQARTLDYNRAGIPVLWVWDIRRAYGSKTLTGFPFVAEGYGWAEKHPVASLEWRVPAEIRNMAAITGEIVVLDHQGNLACCQLHDAKERDNGYYDQSGEYCDSSYVPVTKKRIIAWKPEGRLESYDVWGSERRKIDGSWRQIDTNYLLARFRNAPEEERQVISA